MEISNPYLLLNSSAGFNTLAETKVLIGEEGFVDIEVGITDFVDKDKVL